MIISSNNVANYFYPYGRYLFIIARHPLRMALKLLFPLKLILCIFFILGTSLVSATILKGTIYTAELEPALNVLVEITTIPEQRFLSRDGAYSFEVPPGNYTLTALKGDISISDEVEIV